MKYQWFSGSLIALGICITPFTVNPINKTANAFPLNPTLQTQSQDIETRRQQARQYFQQGLNYVEIGQYKLALESFNQALSIFQDIEDRSGEADTLNNLGSVYSEMGQPKEALKYYNQALPISREVGAPIGEARTLYNIGVTYQRLGQLQEALQCYKQAKFILLPMLREVGTRSEAAEILYEIGLVYRNIRSLQPQLIEPPAQQLIEGPYTTNVEAGKLFQLGVKYYSQGDFKGAQTAMVKALEIDPSMAMAYHILGNALLQQDNNRQAVEQYQQAIRLDPQLLYAYNNLGVALYHLGRYEDAIAAYDQAIAINFYPQVPDEVYFNLAIVYQRSEEENKLTMVKLENQKIKQFFNILCEGS